MRRAEYHQRPGTRVSAKSNLPEVSRLSFNPIRGMAHQGGVTLIELVITIVIISVAVAGVIGAFSLVTGRSSDPLLQSRATALGQLYLDEVIARRFDVDTPLGGGYAENVDCSPEENNHVERDRFVTVNDFHTGPDNPQLPVLASQSGELYSGYEVIVEVACAGGELDGISRNEDAKRIDVTITDPQGQETVISAYKGNF